jgi:hypothetical protein
MGILRNLFGSFASRIVRLAVAAGVLLLCYLFIAKPALDRTTDAVRSGGQRLIHCVEHARQDTRKLERCARRF